MDDNDRRPDPPSPGLPPDAEARALKASLFWLYPALCQPSSRAGSPERRILCGNDWWTGVRQAAATRPGQTVLTNSLVVDPFLIAISRFGKQALPAHQEQNDYLRNS
jgi:hypothetical protein